MSGPCCEVAATELQLFVITGLPYITFHNLAMEHPPPIYSTSMFAFKSCQPRINKPFFFVGVPLPK